MVRITYIYLLTLGIKRLLGKLILMNLVFMKFLFIGQ